MNNKHLPAKQFKAIKNTFQAKKQNGFVTAVNARLVHEWLEVKTPFHKWIQRRIEKYGFVEHIDYCLTVDKVVRGEETNYHCTPDMVKQLAMIESTDKGKTARLYFLDCETKADERRVEVEFRDTLKVEFKPMTDAITTAHDDPQFYHYSTESDMINRIVIGMTAAKFRKHHELDKKDSVRDFMTPLQMKAVIEMQRANTVFINMQQDFELRKEQLTTMFNRMFSVALTEEAKEIEQ